MWMFGVIFLDIQVSVYCLDLELANVGKTDTPGLCLGLSVDFSRFLFSSSSHGVRLSQLGTAATVWPRKPTPVPLWPPQILHDLTQVRNPGRRGGKAATNRLSYVTALPLCFICANVTVHVFIPLEVNPAHPGNPYPRWMLHNHQSLWPGAGPVCVGWAEASRVIRIDLRSSS
jgi:hypothetical protein